MKGPAVLTGLQLHQLGPGNAFVGGPRIPENLLFAVVFLDYVRLVAVNDNQRLRPVS